MKVYLVVNENDQVSNTVVYKEKEQAEIFARAFSTPSMQLIVLEYQVK